MSKPDKNLAPERPATDAPTDYVRWFEDLSNQDVAIAGGKNASLGELIGVLKSKDIRVPDGFAITAHAYRAFLAHNDLTERIEREQQRYRNHETSLSEAGRAIRQCIQDGEMPPPLRTAIAVAYRELGNRYDTDRVDVAVRSSA